MKDPKKVGKWTFYICNVIFLIIGLFMLAIGIYLQVSRNSYVNLLPDDTFFIATALMIVAGILVIIISAVGCCGAMWEQQCMLVTYAVIIVIIFGIEIAAGILGYIYRNSLDEKLESKLLEGLRDSSKRSDWDKVQNEQRCCGVRGPTDWYGYADREQAEVVPDSCCDGPNCGIQGAMVAYDEGCYEKGKQALMEDFYILGVAGIVLAVLLVVLVVSSCCLLFCLRKERKMF